MFKYNPSVLYLIARVIRIGDIGLLLKHLCDTLCTCHTHRNHYKYHGNHHKVHKNCHTVGQEAHKLTCCEQHTAGAYNHLRADPAYKENTGVYRNLHNRVVVCNRLFCFYKNLVDIVAGILEFLLLIILTDISLDNTDCRYILLNTRVQLIVLRKCRIEILGRMSYDDGKNT